jgi:hypothetical protein
VAKDDHPFTSVGLFWPLGGHFGQKTGVFGLGRLIPCEMVSIPDGMVGPLHPMVCTPRRMVSIPRGMVASLRPMVRLPDGAGFIPPRLGWHPGGNGSAPPANGMHPGRNGSGGRREGIPTGASGMAPGADRSGARALAPSQIVSAFLSATVRGHHRRTRNGAVVVLRSFIGGRVLGRVWAVMNSHFLRAGAGWLTLLLLAAPFSAEAFFVTQIRTREHGVLPAQAPHIFLSDKEGNTVTVGGSVNVEEPDETVRNIRLVQLNANQQTVWSALYDPPVTTEQAIAAARDEAGNIYVTGAATLDDFHESVTLKFNSAGQPVWTNHFRPLGSTTRGTLIAVHENGSAAVIYQTDTQVILGKLNSDGEMGWTYPLGNLAVLSPAPFYAGESGSAVAFDRDGNVIVTRSVALNETNARPVVLTVKLNGEGVPLWTNRYEKGMDRHSGIIPQAVVADRFGNVFVAGFSSRLIVNTSTRQRAAQRLTVLAYGPRGRLQWVKHILDKDKLAYLVSPHQLSTDVEGGVCITGTRPLAPKLIGEEPALGLQTARFNWKGTRAWLKRHSLGAWRSHNVQFVRTKPTRVTVHLDEGLDATVEGAPWRRTTVEYFKAVLEED